MEGTFQMARIFKSSSDKALKAGMVILGAGAVLASQTVQQDNASVAHAAKKHASHKSHTASHASHASHSSGSKSSSHASDVRQMHNAYSSYHIKHNSHDRNGAHQVDTNRKGKVTSTTDRHTDANGNVVSTITNHNKARTLRNGTNKETWISKYSNGATSHNNNWDGKHPGQSGFTDANGKDYTFKNAKANQTVTDTAGNVWTYNPVAGHWQQTIEPHNTPAPTPAPAPDPDPTPAPAPDPDPTPAPAPDPDPHPSGNPTPTPHKTPAPIPVQTGTPAPQKPAQTGTPAPQKPAETPKTGDKKTQNGTQTFNFVDKATNKTVDTSKVGGEVGKDVPVSLKVPNGYKLVAGQKVPTSATIKDKDNPINILVEKDANPDRKDGTQTIRFIDKATGKPVAKSTVGGKVGDNIAVDPKVPDGYELVPGQTVPKNVNIKATDTPIDIQVQKKGDNDKNKKPAQQTYQFIDQNGNKVVGTAVVKGNEGDHVPVSLKVPKGYHLVPGQKLPTVADLKATDKPIKILVAKDGTDGNGNADSGINGKNGKPNKGNGAGNNAGNNNAGNNGGNGNGGNGVASLPQTGNSKSNAGILAGSALVATMASLGIAYNKKKRNA